MSQSHESMIDIDDCNLPNVSSILGINTSQQFSDFNGSENDLEIEQQGLLQDYICNRKR